VFWTTLVWLLKGLVVVWLLQLVVFAVGVSLFSKLSPPSGQAAEADCAAEDDAMVKIGRGTPAPKPAT